MKEEKSKRGIVLVASHNTSFRWTFIKALFKHKFDVSEAGDGNVVCNMLEDKKDEWYRCLVLDLDISVMGGLGVIDYTRQILKSKIPIIVTMQTLDEVKFQHAIDAGASASLHDPLDLMRALEKCHVLNDMAHQSPHRVPTQLAHLTSFADVTLHAAMSTGGNSRNPHDPRHSLTLRRMSQQMTKISEAKLKAAEPKVFTRSLIFVYCA